MSEVNKKRMIRNIIAVVGGLLVASIVAVLMERLGHSIYPPPTVSEGASQEEISLVIAAYIKVAPVGALLLVALAHMVGVMAGVAFAFRIQREFKIAGVIVGAFFLLFTVITLLWIPHPFWFMIVDVVGVVIGTVVPWRMLKS